MAIVGRMARDEGAVEKVADIGVDMTIGSGGFFGGRYSWPKRQRERGRA